MDKDVSSWVDVGAAVAIALVGASIAFFWPWIQSLHRARKFHQIVKRELEEIGPNLKRDESGRPLIPRGSPWWRYLSRRFVHEEVFARRNISTNRDFLLTIHPDVVFMVSQLWVAFDKRDGDEWVANLRLLARDRRVASSRLSEAANTWAVVVYLHKRGHVISPPARAPEDAAPHEYDSLFDARLASYRALLPLTQRGQFTAGDEVARGALAGKLTTWFYDEGGGLLLSQESFQIWHRIRGHLMDGTIAPDVIDTEFSELRTSLKIDLGVRHADERDVQALPTAVEGGDA
jgi:hypothetical protein